MFKDLFSLKGRVALVTGGSRGIGKMIAAGFLSHGAAKVYITARKAGPCEATAKELTAEYGGECIALPIDISTMAGIGMLAAEIGKREPKLDILVNNAGAAWGHGFRRVSGKRLGQGDEPQPQDAVLSDQGAGRAAAGCRHRCETCQGHQHRIDRRHLRQPDGDLFLRRQQIGPHSPDAADGRETDPRPRRGVGDRTGTVPVRHEPPPRATTPMKSRPACRPDGLVPTKTWRVRRSISPPAPEITWSAPPSRSNGGIVYANPGIKGDGWD